MTTIKIATWNVNSLRVRLTHLLDWLKANNPDVMALQETKLQDDEFPLEMVEAAGYHPIYSGQKSYNGMALFSRHAPANVVTDIEGYIDPQRRILAATLGTIRILNLYVPNGSLVGSLKYQYKLTWLDHINKFIKNELETHSKLVILGDFNIAPEEIDVHDPKVWEGQVLFSQPEREAFKRILHTGLIDCFRYHNPNEQSYSWWDYRLNAFKRNLGVRIDHILATHALNLHNCYIDKLPRSWERPSDHAPVIAEFSTPDKCSPGQA